MAGPIHIFGSQTEDADIGPILLLFEETSPGRTGRPYQTSQSLLKPYGEIGTDSKYIHLYCNEDGHMKIQIFCSVWPQSTNAQRL